VAKVLELLPSNHEALSLSPKNKKIKVNVKFFFFNVSTGFIVREKKPARGVSSKC
jgi:hypothetical protein